MNKKYLYSLFGGLMLISMASCGGQKAENSVDATDSVAVSVSNVAESQSLLVDTVNNASVLNWKGFKPGGEHFGEIKISEGNISVKEGNLLSGKVVIAMNSIVVKDLTDKGMADKLKAHLESADFFDASTFPVAEFELTDLPESGVALQGLTELKGNLKLKDVSKNITIPVQSVTFDEATKSYQLESKPFTINRADWNVKYGSQSFFKGLGDKFINDDIELSFSIRLK